MLRARPDFTASSRSASRSLPGLPRRPRTSASPSRQDTRQISRGDDVGVFQAAADRRDSRSHRRVPGIQGGHHGRPAERFHPFPGPMPRFVAPPPCAARDRVRALGVRSAASQREALAGSDRRRRHAGQQPAPDSRAVALLAEALDGPLQASEVAIEDSPGSAVGAGRGSAAVGIATRATGCARSRCNRRSTNWMPRSWGLRLRAYGLRSAPLLRVLAGECRRRPELEDMRTGSVELSCSTHSMIKDQLVRSFTHGTQPRPRPRQNG